MTHPDPSHRRDPSYMALALMFAYLSLAALWEGLVWVWGKVRRK